MTSPPAESGRPDTIGGYPIERELGRGGMGVVYLAKDPRLNRSIAIKVLPALFAQNAERVQRFELEARILAAVAHPNIATVFSLEQSNGCHFLTMEFVSGETLAERISRGPVPLEEGLTIAQQIASALEAAHRQGVVHCDLKPANVMVSPESRTKVLDFGLAKPRERARHLTSDDATASGSLGPIVGTPGYASPEQLRGDEVDHRADIWAFGCVLYECITGHQALPGDTPADRIAVTLECVPDWEALPPEVPDRLRRILRRCLQKDLRLRISSITSVRSEIEAVLAGKPCSDPSTPPELEPVSTPHNLLLQLASFVGRERERREVAQALRKHRLVTLTGPGGSGKTRLALETGQDLLPEYPDGIWLVSLADLKDATEVPSAVATVLGLQEEKHTSLVDTLVSQIDRKRMLIILDNCEHLLAASARLTNTLLTRVERLRVLATSREALGITGEIVYRVQPLSVPDLRGDTGLEELQRVESVRLFTERAAAAACGFELSEENARAVSHICRRLDGIPLAIELAAARVRALSPREIAKRLDDCFDLLSVGPQTTEPRHQTLRALIDWSYELLTTQEQTALRRLAVFQGGLSIRAAETICAGDGIAGREVVDLLSRLVERSLLEVRRVGRRDRGPRYRMLETVRAYAHDRLLKSGEVGEVRRRHARYYADLAEKAYGKLTGPEQAKWFEILEGNHENLRAALATCAEGDVPLGLKMAGALGRYWYSRGRWTEGRELMMDFIDRPEASARTGERSRALAWVGWLMFWQGSFDDANRILGEGLSICRELRNDLGVAEALNNLGAVAMATGKQQQAIAYHEEALAIRRREADRRAVAVSVHNLADVHLSLGKYEEARSLYEESLSLFREVGYWMGAADSLSCLGQISEHFGDLETARSCYEESLENRRERNDPRGTAESLQHLGRLAARRGELAGAHALLTESLSIRQSLGERTEIADGLRSVGELFALCGRLREAARVLGAAESLREGLHAPPSADEQEQFDRASSRVRESLSPEAFAGEWQRGRALTLEAAIELALTPTPE